MSQTTSTENHKHHSIGAQKFLDRAMQMSGFKARPAIRNVNHEFDDKLTLGQRIADGVAATMGSWRFIIIQSTILLFWIILNVVALVDHWDPYPFILLNLALSFQAAYAAPFIMMSQNRQAAKDRLVAQNDFDVNKLGEIEIQAVLLHLEEQDRLMLELMKRFDQVFNAQSEETSEHAQSQSGNVSAYKNIGELHGQKLEKEHRLKVEADMWATVHNSLDQSQLVPNQVRDLMGHCYAVINVESFQRNALIDHNFTLDESKLNVLHILYKEAFTSVGGDFDHPDVEDLSQVREWLLQRMRYRSIDSELLDKYAEISQTLIDKVSEGSSYA